MIQVLFPSLANRDIFFTYYGKHFFTYDSALCSQIARVLRTKIENACLRNGKLSEIPCGTTHATYTCFLQGSSRAWCALRIRRGENQMVKTFRRRRAKCNSMEIMFAAFTGTCIRFEEDAPPRPSAVTEILFRELRFSLSCFSRFLIKSAGWGKLQATPDPVLPDVVCDHLFVLSDSRGNASTSLVIKRKPY